MTLKHTQYYRLQPTKQSHEEQAYISYETVLLHIKIRRTSVMKLYFVFHNDDDDDDDDDDDIFIKLYIYICMQIYIHKYIYLYKYKYYMLYMCIKYHIQVNKCHVSAQGVDERMINVDYYYYYKA